MSSSRSEVPDPVVVHQVLEGDRDRFKVLIERYQTRVYGLLKRLVKDEETARDLGQEAFMRAYMNLDQFKPELPFQNWMLKIAQNLAFTHLRRAGVDRERLTLDGPEDRAAETLTDDSPLSDPEAVAESRSHAALAQKVMDGLPEKYRLLLTLRYTQGLSYQDIAQIVGVPLGTVKFRLFQAHKKLTEAFQRAGVME